MTVKITEKDILKDVLAYTGIKEARFSTVLLENDKFRGNCKLAVDMGNATETCGALNIQGDERDSVCEAHCSAAAAAITFLEKTMKIEIVDLNHSILLEKREQLRCLEAMKTRYTAVANSASIKWHNMLTGIRDNLNRQRHHCHRLEVGHKENSQEYLVRMQCIAAIEELLDDICYGYDVASRMLQK